MEIEVTIMVTSQGYWLETGRNGPLELLEMFYIVLSGDIYTSVCVCLYVCVIHKFTELHT